ncbi:hypothetical protein EDB89DRAFT_1979523 [Lactarius sanguifluus]|nr:hypothetical protein EDB89DRAFT_1979523 [Lactarius sanguifluus]
MSLPTFASGVSEDLLDKFFSTPTSTGAPGAPGPTHVSTQAVLEVLRHDFKSHSPFVNRVKFHNHASHHVLAVYALGASPELIRDVYKTHLPVLKPTLVSPVPITQENFIEHLGDERYYDGYLAFFTDYLQSHSPTEALERFIFSPEYNFRSDLAAADGPDSKEKVQPQMLNRFLAGLIHPFIHVAYGLEFGIIGQVVEGLAQAAVHGPDQTELIPPSCFTNSATDTIADLSNLAHSLEIAGFSTSPSASAPEKRPTFAFHRRIRDAAFSVELPSDPLLQYGAVVKSIGGAIYDLVREWTEEWLEGGVGARGSAGAEARLKGMVEEVVWGNVIWYGIGGWASRGTSGRGMNADFFKYALLYSVRTVERRLTLALPTQRTPRHLGPLPAEAYPQGGVIFRFVMRAQHARPLVRQSPAVAPDVPRCVRGLLLTPAGARAGAGWRQAPGSAWPRVIESGVRFPDEHAPKIARALVDFAARWGTRSPGYFSAFVATGEEKARAGAGRAPAPALEGIERLDGTLFVRVAGLTFDRLGWVDEREKAGQWDRDGIPMLDEYNA